MWKTWLLGLAIVFRTATDAAALEGALQRALNGAGEISRFEQPISAGGEETFIPITVIVGARPGPTLLALAGVHGSEYSPIVATQRLGQSVSPGEMSGTLILVHIANVPAYLGRTVYISPADGKNLNRLFPGKPDGTLSDAIAHFLTTELYAVADAVLDIHSGDGNEQLRPSWTGYYGAAGDADVIDASRAMAEAFGLRHIVEFQWALSDPSKAIWGGSAAVAMGLPSIDVEAGGMGVYDERAIAEIEEGVLRIMSHLGMINRAFDAPPAPTIIRVRMSNKAPQNGSWTPLIDAGEMVKTGDLIGYLTDFHGVRIFDATSPADGLLLLRLEAPPVLEGETLATLARLGD